MKIGGTHWRTLWQGTASGSVRIIDQTLLPHAFKIVDIHDAAQMAHAIKTMQVRGAPLIGVAAAYGMALGMREDCSDKGLANTSALLAASRPTAVNLRWALDMMHAALQPLPSGQREQAAFTLAAQITEDDVATSAAMAAHGSVMLHDLARAHGGRPLNILTHCNAGWLAAIDWGTATAPIYRAHDEGLALHVFVDETRPRNQGAALTAFELGEHGVPHSLIVDNAGGHLMQHGEIDVVIVGTDRTAANGDVANKIGTYLKALAAFDNNIPFYVAAPSSSIDFAIDDGVRDVPIEERSQDEVTHVNGRLDDGTLARVRIAPLTTSARNPAFDVTPARLVTGLITERGIIAPNREALAKTFPERIMPRA